MRRAALRSTCTWRLPAAPSVCAALIAAAALATACASESSSSPDDGAAVTAAGGTTAAAARATSPSASATAPLEAARPRPAAGASWQWQLMGEINTSYAVDVYDIDLFDTPEAVIRALHDAGRYVVCYFSAGSREDWREDAGAFPADVIGRPLGDWEGEHWVDVRAASVLDVLLKRLDHARDRGCDGVEPDNVDGFANDTGFAITAADQVAFNRELARAAHERGLAIALKNAPELVPAVVDVFDFAVTEQCHEQDWCEAMLPFIQAGKPVFNAEYADDPDAARARAGAVCADAARLGIATLVLPLALDDAFGVACRSAD